MRFCGFDSVISFAKRNPLAGLGRADFAKVLIYELTRGSLLSIKKRIDAEEDFCAPVEDAEFEIIEMP